MTAAHARVAYEMARDILGPNAVVAYSADWMPHTMGQTFKVGIYDAESKHRWFARVDGTFGLPPHAGWATAFEAIHEQLTADWL